MKKNIAIIGESCIDEYIYGTCERVCPEAAALCFMHNNVNKTNSGMAGNTFNNFLKLNQDNFFHIELITSKSPIIKRRFVDQRYNTIVFREDICDHCESINLSDHDFGKYDCIVFSDYCKGFLSEQQIDYICKIKNKNCITFIDTKKLLTNFIKNIDFIKINSKEFSNNISNFKLINSSSCLIVTSGDNGASLYLRGIDEPINYPTEKVELRDVCGAGDTFLAGLVIQYLKTQNINTAIEYANICASKVVKQFGVVTP